MNEGIENNTSEGTNQIQYSAFVTHETPHCLWDLDLEKSNGEFLDGIDPLYFKHMADVHGPLLEGENKQYAAMALRAAYTQGLETLFALIACAAQAPDCPVGWMLCYRNDELDEVIKKIHNNKPIMSKFNTDFFTWEMLSTIIHQFELEDSERTLRVRKLFAKLWQRFASDFLDEKSKLEYNSVKHGLRARMGGFKLSFGPQIAPEIPATPESMINLGGSEFGSTFYHQEKLTDPRNIRVKSQSLNWNPNKFVSSLILISYSILNVVNYLKYVNSNEKGEVDFYFPRTIEDERIFEKPWEDRVSTTSFNFNTVIDPKWIKPLSKTDILETYKVDD
jgi:hypothetical protein